MFTILIVEDDIKVQAQFKKSINTIDKEIKVLTAKKGEEAIQIVKHLQIDVFIIDIILPDWDGFELAKKIRTSLPLHPIIIESSKGDDKYQVHVYDKIANLAFLKKPLTHEKIIAKVNYAVKISEALESNKLIIRQNGFLRKIKIKDILYVEKIKNTKKLRLVLYISGKQCLTSEEFNGLTLNALLNMLEEDNDLFRCHKGYIINPKMIEKLNYAENTICLRYTDIEIPIGKTYRSAINLLL